MKKPLSIILLSSLLLFQIAPLVHADSTGNTKAGTGVNDNDQGIVAWTNPGNITADDTSYATATLGDGEDTNFLKATNFGFSLPADITIDGIEARVNQQSSASNAIAEMSVVLVIGGTVQTDVGEDDKQTGASWPTSFATTTYGGSSDLWGQSPAPSDTEVEASTFGFAIRATTAVADETASVDFMEMNVYYSLPPELTIWHDSTPTDNDIDCGYQYLVGGFPADDLTVHFIFGSSVTGFEIGDISTTAGVLSNFQGSGASYSVEVDSLTDNGSDGVEAFTISVAANVVDENNSADSRRFVARSNANLPFCNCFDETTDILWRLNEGSGTSAEDTSGFDEDGRLNNFTGSHWQKCKSSTSEANTYSLAFDGTDDYIDLTSNTVFGPNATFFASVWLRSDHDDPDNFVALQINDSANANVLTIAYRNDTTNFLHVSRQVGGASVQVSDTAFDITDWNHIVVKVNGSTDVIDEVYVNGSDVKSAGTAGTAAAGTATEQVLVGVANNSSTMENYFDGLIDEVGIFETIETGTLSDFATDTYNLKNTSCTALSTYSITNLPGTHAVRLVSNDSTNPASTALVGNTYSIRLKEGSVPVVDVDVDLTSNRNWSAIVADEDGANSKAVVDFDAGHGNTGEHTLYVTKNSNTSLRVCPNAEALEDVSSDCTNGVLIADGSSASVTFPSGTSTVSVTSPEIGGTEFLAGAGMLGSGGQGEGGGGGGQAPEFTWWALILLGMMCAYVLLRDPRFMHMLQGPRIG